jgi:hypothetical protein
METNSEQNGTSQSEKIKSLYLSRDVSETAEADYFPYFYAETRIDLNDVRTGFRESWNLSQALEIHDHPADLFWVDDMIVDVDPGKIQFIPPDNIRLGSLPEFVDDGFLSLMENQYIQYLLRSFEARLFKNSALNIYSNAGESRDDFIARCIELSERPMRKELDQVRDVFNRRLEQLKEKYHCFDESLNEELSQLESRNRDAISQYSEHIAALFSQGNLRFHPEQFVFPSKVGMELEELLFGFEQEVQRTIGRILESYEDKAQALDEYILHPNLKDMYFVRSCILWMPKKAV